MPPFSAGPFQQRQQWRLFTRIILHEDPFVVLLLTTEPYDFSRVVSERGTLQLAGRWKHWSDTTLGSFEQGKSPGREVFGGARGSRTHLATVLETVPEPLGPSAPTPTRLASNPIPGNRVPAFFPRRYPLYLNSPLVRGVAGYERDEDRLSGEPRSLSSHLPCLAP